MLVTGFLAGPTNCYVVAPGPGEQCVVIDPGAQAVPQLEEVLAEHRLHPVAVILTHGHFDHTFSVQPVCDARDIPAYIHPADRAQLADPWSGIGAPKGSPLFGQITFAEPAEVKELTDGEKLEIAGIELTVRLAPGHTPGSVVFDTTDAAGAPITFSGDVLFEGSIGRVDLPGGSEEEMFRTLARVILPMADETVVHPGHGNSTTIGRERGTNPYLRLAAQQAAGPAPRTGL